MGEQKPEKTKKHICAGLLAHVYDSTENIIANICSLDKLDY